MDTWTRISLQFTNLARAAGVGHGDRRHDADHVRRAAHLNTVSLARPPDDPHTGANPNGAVGSLNTVLPVTDPIVSNGGIVSVRLTRCARARVAGPGGTTGVLRPDLGRDRQHARRRRAASARSRRPAWSRICLLARRLRHATCPSTSARRSTAWRQGGGVGGILTIGQLGTIRISILGAPYTVKTITAFNRTNNGAIDTFTEKGFAHGPLSNTSSTGQTSGVLQVVTTNHTNDGGRAGELATSRVSSRRILVHFIPEPGLLLLLGSGAVGMALLGRKRIRK